MKQTDDDNTICDECCEVIEKRIAYHVNLANIGSRLSFCSADCMVNHLIRSDFGD